MSITKKELIEVLSQYPNDIEIYIEASSDFVVPSGEYQIVHVRKVERNIDDKDTKDFLVIEAVEK